MAQRSRRRRVPAPTVEQEPVSPEPEAVNTATEEEPPMAEAKPETLVALGRCRYSNNEGKVITAEPGEPVLDCNEKDLADLREAGLLESFDADTVKALQIAKGKNVAALRAILKL